jgi:NAD(P)-dependent dehydrogenase (short-subunit alcohol dehydrogenase family)
VTTEMRPGGGAVFVTGASSGIGQACALHLDRLGLRVFASVLPGEDGAVLRQKASERLSVVELDVTEPTSVAAAAETIAAAVGADGLTGLVNNAGIGSGRASGPLEFLPLDTLRRQFEVNVIGQIAVTQAFLPLLRRGHGRIVMMSSMTSYLICPFTSPYAASKAALQSLAAALRVELRPWAIPVSIVLGGIIATPIWEKTVHELDETTGRLPREAHDLYGPAIAATREFVARVSRLASPPEVIAAAVGHALTAKRPRTCYVAGRAARLTRMVMRLALSDEMRDRIVVRTRGLPGGTP